MDEFQEGQGKDGDHFDPKEESDFDFGEGDDHIEGGGPEYIKFGVGEFGQDEKDNVDDLLEEDEEVDVTSNN